jgi:hypothetical protein
MICEPIAKLSGNPMRDVRKVGPGAEALVDFHRGVAVVMRYRRWDTGEVSAVLLGMRYECVQRLVGDPRITGASPLVAPKNCFGRPSASLLSLRGRAVPHRWQGPLRWHYPFCLTRLNEAGRCIDYV